MSKNRTRFELSAIIFLLLFFAPIVSRTQVCGDPHAHPGSQSTVVALKQKPHDPAFYYRVDDYLIFISPDQVMAALRAQEINGDRTVKRLRSLISDRLPLKVDQDLFYFNIFDWLFYNTIQKTVEIAIENGNAAITDLSGVWLDKATIVHKRNKGISNTIVYAGGKGEKRLLSLLDCISE